MWSLFTVAWGSEYEDCQNQARTTAQLTQCDVAESDRLEALMPDLYARLAAGKPKHLELLQKSHTAWVAFRTALCAAPEDEKQLPSLVMQGSAMCYLEAATRRVAELEGRSAPAEPEWQRCQQGGSQALLACVTEAHKREDKRLNTVYGQVMASSLPQVEKDWVQKTERAWIPWRDATCAEQTLAQGGGSLPPVRCALRLTTDQADWLKKQL